VQRHDGRQAKRPGEVEDRLAVLAAPDRVVELDRDDVGTGLERARGPRVVGALVTPDPVMDLEGIRRDRLGRMECDDLAVRGDPAQVARERRDPALARRIGGDVRGAGDGGAPIGNKREKRKSGPP
jgi:hypothetical protein